MIIVNFQEEGRLDIPKEALEPYRFIKKLKLVFQRIEKREITEDQVAQY
jgi:hypothetical protein